MEDERSTSSSEPSSPTPDAATPPAERPVVAVSGIGTSDEQQVEMVEGATGARLPANREVRSLAVPDRSNEVPGSVLPALLAIALLVIAVVVLLVVLLG